MTPEPADPAPAEIGPGTPFDTRRAMLAWVQEIAPYGIFATDENLIVRHWNQWLVTHSGLTADSVVGRHLFQLFPDLAARRLDESYGRALRGEVSVLSAGLHRYLLPFPAAGNEYGLDRMLQTARIAPLPAGDRIVGTITIIEDVTQREGQASVLRRQQEYDRLLTDALALLLRSEQPLDIAAAVFPRISTPLKLDVFLNYLVGPDGSLQLHAAGGVTPEARRAMAILAPGEDFCGLAFATRAPVVESRVHLNESPRAHAARRLGLRAYAGFPLMIGDRALGSLAFGSYERESFEADEIEVLAKIAQYVAIALDRGLRDEALREAQQRLSEHAEELEARIAERTAKLQDTIAQLESFSYTIAHDLRAPMRSLTGFTEVLLSDYAQNLPEEGRSLLGRLRRAGRHLDALTRDLLRFNQLVRQEVKLEPIDLDELVAEIASATPALGGGVLRVHGPLGCVWGQPTLLQQCFSNLFDNALKFARPGAPLAIVVRAEKRSEAAAAAPKGPGAPFHSPVAGGLGAPAGPRWRIWVEDNGIGIPPQAHGKIFGIFERVPGPKPIEGTGIGLAIVARATEQMGGAYGVESAPGKGSRFWLEFPVAEKLVPA